MIQTSFFPQPEKDKPMQIIQKIDTSILQPRKVEEVIPEANILPDTYMLYPRGGYHPFYGVPNTFPRYQLPIWPFVKRIKWNERWKTEKSRNGSRTARLRENNTNEQINPTWTDRYYIIGLKLNERVPVNYYAQIKKNGKHVITMKDKTITTLLHRLVALAFIPNPKKYKLVLHNNDDSTNYLIENLKWGTYGHNMKGKIWRRPDTQEQKYLNMVGKGIIKG
jgi:hypothetical protein